MRSQNSAMQNKKPAKNDITNMPYCRVSIFEFFWGWNFYLKKEKAKHWLGFVPSIACPRTPAPRNRDKVNKTPFIVFLNTTKLLTSQLL
jgi:hypothetical protein